MPDQPPFEEPHIVLTRIYTKTGDEGETLLASGERVPKDAPRVACYGAVDELNAFVGAAALTASAEAARAPALEELARILLRIQHELFNLGSILATTPEHIHPRQPRITDADVLQLEHEIDRFNAPLPALASFVLPGGSRLNVELHICRTVCRRAERVLIAASRTEQIDPVNLRYLNRLSDAFFVWSRWANAQLGAPELLWSPNESASARGPRQP